LRFVKLFFISAIMLFLVVTLLSAILPSHIRISRAINIGAPIEKVYKIIDDLATWDKWNGFIINTPLTHKSVSSPSVGSGAKIASDQLIVRIEKSGTDSIVTSWEQANAKHFSGGYNIMQLRADSVTVQWYFDFHFKWYPWEKFTSLVYDKQLGPVMEESLGQLKKVAEN
jgi:hypothetical protein